MNVWFQKISIPPPPKTLWFAPSNPQDFPFQRGLWWPSSPQEFPEFLNGDFFMSKWFWYFKKKKVNTNSLKYGRILLQQCKLLWSLLAFVKLIIHLTFKLLRHQIYKLCLSCFDLSLQLYKLKHLGCKEVNLSFTRLNNFANDGKNTPKTYKVSFLADYLSVETFCKFLQVDSYLRTKDFTNTCRRAGFHEHCHDCKSNFTSQVAGPSEDQARNGNKSMLVSPHFLWVTTPNNHW